MTKLELTSGAARAASRSSSTSSSSSESYGCCFSSRSSCLLCYIPTFALLALIVFFLFPRDLVITINSDEYNALLLTLSTDTIQTTLSPPMLEFTGNLPLTIDNPNFFPLDGDATIWLYYPSFPSSMPEGDEDGNSEELLLSAQIVADIPGRKKTNVHVGITTNSKLNSQTRTRQIDKYQSDCNSCIVNAFAECPESVVTVYYAKIKVLPEGAYSAIGDLKEVIYVEQEIEVMCKSLIDYVN